MKKSFFFVLACVVSMTSCNLDFFPSDEVNSGFLTESYEGLCTMTDGVYSMFKDAMEYKGTSSTSYTFCRRAMEMAEFTSDNQIISGRTTSTIFNAYTYENTDNLQNVSYVWWCCYKVIFSANMVIEAIPDNASANLQALKGECLFLRAFAHLWLCNLYARPYALGRDNVGVVIRTSTNTDVTTRATVGECYDQIVQDLNNAIELMGLVPRRGFNNGYASKEAAQGLLSRVYLQMERNEDCVAIIDDMLAGAEPASKLSSNGLQNFYANTLTDPEALWCIAYTTIDGGELGQSLLAGMYLNDPVSGLGWGEAYASDVLIDLYERYPEDKRYTELIHPQFLDNGKYQARYPLVGVDNREHRDCFVAEATLNSDGSYTFKDADENTVIANQEQVNTYPLWFATIKGQKMQVHIHPSMTLRNTFPKYYVSKFSYQDGQAMLASPAMIRWGELILNRAEAYAKLGQNEKALADVNTIRVRAGIPSNGMFTTANMQERGYATVLDVVLAERQLELAFEGFRTLDVYRNKRSLDRFFPGLHSWESISYEDNRIVFPIPYDEICVSNIKQNPGY